MNFTPPDTEIPNEKTLSYTRYAMDELSVLMPITPVASASEA